MVNMWKVILATMVIFGSGVVTGTLLSKALMPSPAPQALALAPTLAPTALTAPIRVVEESSNLITAPAKLPITNEGAPTQLELAPPTPPPNLTPPARPPEPRLPNPPAQIQRLQLLGRMSAQLNLTTQQRNRIEVIIQDNQARAQLLWAEVAPQMQKVVSQTREAILAELTPVQRQEFKKLLAPAPARRGGSAGK